MGRLKKNQRGMTLVELFISVILFITVLVTGSSLFLTFKKSFLNYTKSQPVIADAILGAFEDMTQKISRANDINITNSGHTLAVRVDDPSIYAKTPENYADDITHTYEWNGTATKLYYKSKTGTAAETSQITIASNITSMLFSGPRVNSVSIALTVQPANSTAQSINSTITAQCRNAQT